MFTPANLFKGTSKNAFIQKYLMTHRDTSSQKFRFTGVTEFPAISETALQSQFCCTSSQNWMTLRKAPERFLFFISLGPKPFLIYKSIFRGTLKSLLILWSLWACQSQQGHQHQSISPAPSLCSQIAPEASESPLFANTCQISTPAQTWFLMTIPLPTQSRQDLHSLETKEFALLDFYKDFFLHQSQSTETETPSFCYHSTQAACLQSQIQFQKKNYRLKGLLLQDCILFVWSREALAIPVKLEAVAQRCPDLSSP